jgi:hypothetical protein
VLKIEAFAGFADHQLERLVSPQFHPINPTLTIETQAKITVSQGLVLVFLDTSCIVLSAEFPHPLPMQGGETVRYRN